MKIRVEIRKILAPKSVFIKITSQKDRYKKEKLCMLQERAREKKEKDPRDSPFLLHETTLFSYELLCSMA